MKQISYLTMFFLPGSLMAVTKFSSSCSVTPLTYTIVGNIWDVKPKRIHSCILCCDYSAPHCDYVVDRHCVAREKVPPKDLYPTAQLAFHVDQGPPSSWAELQVKSTSRKRS